MCIRDSNATDEDGKEFYTITTADESVFYLVIDKQKTSENVYFLNTVTTDDLLIEQKGIPGKILTTDYLTFSQPKALDRLAQLKNIELKMFRTNSEVTYQLRVWHFSFEALK